MFASAAGLPDASALVGLVGALGELPQDVDDKVRVDRIRALEELKAAAAAAQARETAAFVASRRAAQRAAGVPAERAERGIAHQVAFARRISPSQAARYAGWATILTTELPQTFAALAQGRTSEHRAFVVTRESVFLSREHRAVVDAELAPRLEELGDRRVEAEARRIGYRLDPAGFVQRAGAAATDRRVTVRPAPDVMCRLTALLPAAQGIAAYAALSRAADTRPADGRSRGQVMADTLVQRVTGQATATDVPVEICLTMTAESLFRGDEPGGATPGDAATGDASGDAATDDAAGGSAGCGAAQEPAHLDGYGPIPAETARRLVLGPADTTPMWLRRLYLDPASGQLVAMDSRRRCFTPAQRQYVRLRDQTCRTPWCEAPIRQVDHVLPHADGGPTGLDNAQGYCQACNLAKQAPGWQTTVTGTGAAGHEVQITTPTGHRYRSRAPRPPGPEPRGQSQARLRRRRR